MKTLASLVVLSLSAFAALQDPPAKAPPADPVKQRLENSPRHHEWIDVATEGGRKVRSFVVYPESGQRKLAVIVLHENRGLTEWVRAFADRVAGAGYIAIAPDLLSQYDDAHKRTSDFARFGPKTRSMAAIGWAENMRLRSNWGRTCVDWRRED